MLVKDKRTDEVENEDSNPDEEKSAGSKADIRERDNFLLVAIYSKNLASIPCKIIKFKRNLKTKMWTREP